MKSIKEAKTTMYELHQAEKFEELLKHCIGLLKDASQNLSNYDKLEILQCKEYALRRLSRHAEADEVNIEIMNMPKDIREDN